MRNIKQKFIRQAATITSACLILTGSPWQAAQGQQRPTSLFQTNCITSSGASSRSTDDVVIGREVFTAIASIYTSSSFTCRIRPAGSQPNFATLRLAFGVADDASIRRPVSLNVYLDGSLVTSRSLSPGQRTFVVLDVSRTSSIALETSQTPSGVFMTTGPAIFITQALLEPISSSPGQR